MWLAAAAALLGVLIALERIHGRLVDIRDTLDDAVRMWRQLHADDPKVHRRFESRMTGDPYPRLTDTADVRPSGASAREGVGR